MRDAMFSDYWPWWVGGPAFAVVVVGFWLIERRIFGVVGQYVRVLEASPGDEAMERASPEAVDAALLAATLAEFGPEAVAELEAAKAAEPAAPAEPARAAQPPRASLLFLLMLPVGGALGALVSGRFAIRMSLGEVYERVVAPGALGLVALFAGGLLVGIGTRMAGGCTSGHGLSGCSRLRPSSLAATASFFGTGVLVSFLLEALVRR